ncbi:MAG: DUF4339 domain-containing protein [Oligoflexia bacterium]|nr:DUF4339 domain-containing protein [Oligoflexia bacterium]
METKWFYVKNKERVGPITQEELRELIIKKQLGENSYVWKKGFENWKKIREVIEIVPFLSESMPLLKPSEMQVATKAPTVAQMLETSETEQLSLFDWSRVSKTDRIFFVKQKLDAAIYGPYSLDFVSELFQQNRVNIMSLIFAPKLTKWVYFFEIPNVIEVLFLGNLSEKFDADMKEISKISTNKSAMELVEEVAPTILASIYLADTEKFDSKQNSCYGVCRDLSVGGTQVLFADCPVQRGSKLKIKLFRATDIKEKDIKKTDIETDNNVLLNGTVARILDGDQGAFVLFSDVTDEEQRSLNEMLFRP